MMKMVFIYWERNNDGTANYDRSHNFEIDITGKSAAEIMHEYWGISEAHDIHKYTPIEFCGVI